MNPVYLVSSFHRSGSSMMMRCLEAGGMKVRSTDAHDSMNINRADYVPNPNGFYAPPSDEVIAYPSFYNDTAGKVMKLQRYDFSSLPKASYKIIYLKREPKEIIASMRKFTPYLSWGHMECAVYLYDILQPAVIRNIKKRGDTEVLELNYREIVESPNKQFQTIRDFGLNIDVDKAAAMVDPALYRLRLE